MWVVHGYWWLESNNLYKATVAFFVTLLLGVALGAIMRPWRAWKRHRETQEKIADRLDTSTPGGLSDLIHALRGVLDKLDEGEEPDDNGADLAEGKSRRKPGGSHHTPEAERERGARSSIPNVHGGGNAGHR